MKMMPIVNFKKKLHGASERKLFKLLGTTGHRSNTIMYQNEVVKELERRGIDWEKTPYGQDGGEFRKKI